MIFYSVVRASQKSISALVLVFCCFPSNASANVSDASLSGIVRILNLEIISSEISTLSFLIASVEDTDWRKGAKGEWAAKERAVSRRIQLGDVDRDQVYDRG